MAFTRISNSINNVTSTISLTSDPRSTLETALQATSMCIILSSGIIGNGLILIAIYIDKTLQTVTNAFVVNLACADLLLSLLGMPFTLVSSITYNWIFGPVWCDLNGMSNSLFCVASMLTLAAVSIDRYIAIIHPLKYTSYMTSKSATGMIIYIWVHSLIIALLPVMDWSRYTFLKKESICTVHWELDISCTIFIFAVCFFLPFAIMTFTYSRIFKTAWKQSKRIVPVTGRFSERKKPKERPDSRFTCEPISVGSIESLHPVSRTGSTILHTSLSTDEQFTYTPDKPIVKEEFEFIGNRSIGDKTKFQEVKLFAHLSNNNQDFHKSEAHHLVSDPRLYEATSEKSANLEDLTSKYSSNCYNDMDINTLKGTESSNSSNSITKQQMIINQKTIVNNHICHNEPWLREGHNRCRGSQYEGVHGIVHHSKNYSQNNTSSKHSNAKKDVLDSCNEKNSNFNTQFSQDLSENIFGSLGDQRSEQDNKLVQNQARQNIRSRKQAVCLNSNKLPPLRTENTNDATPALNIDVIVTSESPSQSPQAPQKRRRVTVPGCYHISQPFTPNNGLTLNRQENQSKHSKGEPENTSTSSPCLQKRLSKASLNVEKTPTAKRKFSTPFRPNINALRKKSVNTKGLLKLKQEKKAVRTLLIVVGTFAICWLPHFIGIFCILTRKCTWPDRYFAITTWLAMLNSGCNPIIYGAMSRQFRKRFRQILQCKRGFF